MRSTSAMSTPTETLSPAPVPATRIAIIGAGHVGVTFAYTLMLSGVASEIVLIDANQARAEGEAMDLAHSIPFARPARVWAGTLADCEGAAVIVIAAGVGQKPGETRLDLLKRNAEVLQGIVPEAARRSPSAIFLMATNPVDILTYAAWKLSGLPSSRVLGSGTILDTARFRYLLSRHFGVDPRSVHAYILGEHGDSEVPAWSLTTIAGMRLRPFCEANGIPFEQDRLDAIFRDTRDAAYQIIERKGATYYAIAVGLMRIVEAILRDQSSVLTVSSLMRGELGLDDVCLSLPTVVDRSGVTRVLHIDLEPGELESLRRSASILKATLAQLDLPR